MMTYLDLWSELQDMIPDWFVNALFPEDPMWQNEVISDEEEEDDIKAQKQTLFDDEHEHTYWEQVIHDVATHNSPFTKGFYAGPCPDTSWHNGPLVASTMGKHILNTMSGMYDWQRLPRLSRFLVLEQDGSISTNVRQQEKLYLAEPTLAPVISQWYGMPWWVSDRPLDAVHKEITSKCAGLHHLEFFKTVSDTTANICAPETYVYHMPVETLQDNWRLHELWCMRTDFGWITLRTIFGYHPDSTIRQGVFFYTSVFARNSNPCIDAVLALARKLIATKYQDMRQNVTVCTQQHIGSDNWMLLHCAL